MSKFKLEPYSDEWYEWGESEAIRRKEDMKTVESAEDLGAVKALWEKRRKEVGLTIRQAELALAKAKERREEWARNRRI